MLVEWVPLILLGFGLGLMHALDADHVMAVSALANQNPSVKRTLLFSLHWALGHGGVLLACGLILFGLGINIPSSFQYVAEVSVGVLLILLGLSFFWQCRQQKIQLVEHSHDDVVHTHWSAAEHGETIQDAHHGKTSDEEKAVMIKKHQPVMIGMLHGLAGSAPALALIPAVASGQLTLAISYLMVFSLGVIISMLFFGLGFSWLQQYLHRYYRTIYTYGRHTVAVVAIGVGVLLLVKTV